jgi:metal-dependent amidase/aminoacylase/carboxypeptidase family protein
MPHHGIDPVVVGSHIVTALQSIVARNVDPMDTAVVSTTQIHAGDTWNVIPQECVLRGTVRTFKKPVQDLIEKQIEKIARNVAAGFGAEVTKWRYERRYPATVNSEQETEFAAKARIVAGRPGERESQPDAPPWAARISPGCFSRSRAATSGSATATASAAAWFTIRVTTSTTRSCPSARPIGRPSSSSSLAAKPCRKLRSNV